MLMLAAVMFVVMPTSWMQAPVQSTLTPAAVAQQSPPQTQAAASVPEAEVQEPSGAAGLPRQEQQTQQQSPPVVSQDTVPGEAAQRQAPGEKRAFTIPAGTRIPLTLASPIYPKHARRGDAIHATTAFPVTLSDQVAIPAGVLVEGVVDKLVKKDRLGRPWIQAHFTRMVFPNGYVLSLEAQSSEARAKSPESFDEQEQPATAHENGPSAGDAFDFQLQQPNPTLPPAPKPNYTPAIVGGIAGAAVAVAIAVIAAHHRYDYLWYDVGFQFDMVLQSPLQVDAANWNADVSN
jgi:hypothetical protein